MHQNPKNQFEDVEIWRFENEELNNEQWAVQLFNPPTGIPDPFFFGAAWLIKGRALGYEGKIGEKLYRERNGLQ